MRIGGVDGYGWSEARQPGRGCRVMCVCVYVRARVHELSGETDGASSGRDEREVSQSERERVRKIVFVCCVV